MSHFEMKRRAYAEEHKAEKREVADDLVGAVSQKNELKRREDCQPKTL